LRRRDLYATDRWRGAPGAVAASERDAEGHQPGRGHGASRDSSPRRRRRRHRRAHRRLDVTDDARARPVGYGLRSRTDSVRLPRGSSRAGLPHLQVRRAGRPRTRAGARRYEPLAALRHPGGSRRARVTRPRLVAVLGPTASGKSALGLALAERHHGEIINCDSTAVYRGFDIGTDKLPVEARRGIPHHLVDIADPTEVYTAAQFARDAAAAIRDVHA